MHLRVDASGAVTLDDPDDCTSFSITGVAPSSAAVEAAVRASGIELCDGATHGYVAPDVVVLLAEGRVGEGWAERFDGMVRFAGSKGWLDGSGRIRGHTDWSAG